MENASHGGLIGVGRVGALAVALGIGMAVASSTGVASADPTDAASADTAPAARSGATRPVASATPARTRRQAQSGARPAAAARSNSPAPAAAIGRAARQARSSVSFTSPTPVVAASVAPASGNTQSATAASSPVAVTAAATSNPVDAIAHAVSVTVAQFITTVLSPLAGDGGPLSPSGSPLLWTALAWARRELGGSPSGASTAAVTMSDNLLINGGAESGDPSLTGNASVTIPGWTVTGTPTVIQYGTPRNSWPVGLSSATPNLPAWMGFPATSSGPGDTQFFGGGNVATSTLTQTVGLSGPSAAGVTYDLSADLGGWLINPGAASVKVDFLDANKLYLGSASIGPVNLFDRFFQTTLLNRSTTGTLPTGTQYAQVTVDLKAWKPIFAGLNPDYNSAFADNVSFTVSDPALAAPQTLAPPASTVGTLDHVFMVYMENKGYNDIVGSPNAPFLNSLINNFGFADNYYALTHGSLPNYYPIVGGTGFNITYNCKDACITSTDPTLVSNIDAAGLTWRSYAQGLVAGADPLVSSGEYAVDETPFPAFQSIAGDPAYAAAHILPIEQMAIDLESTATAPNFAWFAADENSAGEGPTTFPVGTLKFVLNQLDPRHQYNVPALDAYLQEYVPVITNSNVWQDPTQKSVVVVTFDEDNNNLSLGFGNEGNHVVTVVIPSPGAIAAGMLSGNVIDATHYDHYSLLRTIEEALGLPSLTNNDKYAVPMNGFWGTGAGSGAGSVV